MYTIEGRVHLTRDVHAVNVDELWRLMCGEDGLQTESHPTVLGPREAQRSAASSVQVHCFHNGNKVSVFSRDVYARQEAANVALVYFKYTGQPADDVVFFQFTTHNAQKHDRFEQHEIDNFFAKVDAVWGTRACVIYNRDCALPKPLLDIGDTDSLREISDFLLFDVQAAINHCTTPCPVWPYDIAERRFQCWACNTPKHSDSFAINAHYQTFYDKLNFLVMHAKFPCCSDCLLQHSFKSYTPFLPGNM